MKRKHAVYLMAAAILLFAGLSVAAQLQDDISQNKSCKLCGMDRGAFNFSRMLVEYEGGSSAAFCSLHCAAVDMAGNIDKAPKAILVAELNGKQLIDAEKAFWVVGGSKPGVMTKRGKWAFEKQSDAEAFQKVNQGQVVSFDDAMRMAYEDTHEDTKQIRERRKMKRMQMMQQQIQPQAQPDRSH